MVGCASQRTRATCAETEYRLNSMSYSPDQRAFLEEELRQCRAEQAEQEKDEEKKKERKKNAETSFKNVITEAHRTLGLKVDATIEEIKTICWCGKKAICNARVYNGRICADLGLTAPEGYTVIEGTEK